MERRQKTNPLQWSVFLDFAEQHPEILTKKFDGVHGKSKYNELWKEISTTLNSMGFLQKTTDKWQKAVSDWRCKVKAKAANINQGLSQTGGGGPMPSLTDNENRLLAILGWTAVTGTNVPELGFSIQDSEPTKESSKEPVKQSANPNINTGSLTDASCSPPPLIWSQNLNSKNNEADKELEEVSGQKENYEEIASSFKAKTISMKRSRVQSVIVTPSALKSSSTPLSSKSRLKRSSNNELKIMHEDTMNMLKELNKNLSRMADAQEKMCSILERKFE